MINHARSLLLNAPYRSRQPDTYPGEEVVPENFNGVDLDRVGSDMLRALYGGNTDRARKNAVLRLALGVTEAGELGPFLTRHDARRTTPPWNDAGWKLPVRVTDRNPPGLGRRLSVIGNPTATPVTSYWRFTVTVLDPAAVSVVSEVGPGGIINTPVTAAGGLSSPVALGDSGVSVLVTPDPGAIWTVELVARPVLSVYGIVAAWEGVIGSGEALFGPAPAEPVASWQKIWTQRDEVLYRLPAALLALVDHLEGLRTHQ